MARIHGQRVFGYMSLSDRAYADLRRPLDALLGSGSMQVGSQQDVQEFNLLFLDRIETALVAHATAQVEDAAAAAGHEPGEAENLIKSLFYGTQVYDFEATEEVHRPVVE